MLLYVRYRPLHLNTYRIFSYLIGGPKAKEVNSRSSKTPDSSRRSPVPKRGNSGTFAFKAELIMFQSLLDLVTAGSSGE